VEGDDMTPGTIVTSPWEDSCGTVIAVTPEGVWVTWEGEPGEAFLTPPSELTDLLAAQWQPTDAHDSYTCARCRQPTSWPGNTQHVNRATGETICSDCYRKATP
jgi:hypothetical protein